MVFNRISTKLIFWACLLEFVKCQDVCMTPGDKFGKCVPVKSCEPIINILKSAARPYTENLVNTLKQYKCSWIETSVLACCPDSPIILPNSTENQRNSYPVDADDLPYPDLLPVDCGNQYQTDVIGRPGDAALLEFPWTALLAYQTKSGPQFKCGGTIINNKYILTAASCITNLSQPLLGVRIGEYNIAKRLDCLIESKIDTCTDPYQDLHIEEVLVHPNYDSINVSNDIGLLRVNEMNLTVENARPICLPVSKRLRNVKLTLALVTGFKLPGQESIDTILHRASVSIKNKTECQKAFSSFKEIHITDKHICAESFRNGTVCPSIGGDPLQIAQYLYNDVRMVQYGVMSFGQTYCGLIDVPVVFTNVVNFVDWIIDSLKP